MKKYELIIFDLDGTLLDSVGPIVKTCQEVARDFGLEPPAAEVVRQGIGLSGAQRISQLFPGVSLQKAESLLAEFQRRYYGTEELPYSFFDEVESTLKYLKDKGYYLAIATGMSKRGLDVALNKTILNSLIDRAICAEETASKPDPEMLNVLLAEFQIEPTQALMIGDTEYDIQLAQNAKVEAIAVSYGAHDADYLKSFDPLHIIHHISELKRIL